jgi:hypothetical protein
MKKGEFALSNVSGMLLILVSTLAIVMLIYFFKDKIYELKDIILGLFKL